MPIDPSIAAGQPAPNLMQTLMGATQLKGQIMQQKSNMAMSQALQQSIDPATGQPDIQKAFGLIAQSPDAAYNLPAFQSQMLQNQNAQVQYDASKLKLAGDSIGFLSNGFGGLLASGNMTPGAVMAMASQGIKQGLFSPEEAVSFTSDMPTDPAQLSGWVKQKYVGFGQDSARLQSLMPQTQVINNGAGSNILAIDPMTGQPKGSSTFIPNTLTPGESAAPRQFFDPNTGTTREVPTAQWLQMQGQAPTGAVGQPGAPGSDLGTGRIQPRGGAPGMAPQGAPGLQTAPAIGSQTAAETLAKGSADNVLALQAQADAAPQAVYQLQNMRTALKDFTPGPTADWASQAKALALQVSPDIAKKFGGIDPQNVASQEEFHKYATNLAQGMSQTLGAGSDAKLASAVAGNPNTSLTKLGNEQIIQVLIANQRALQAKNLAFQNSGLPPEKFNQFSSDFNKQIDPRVFAAQDMDRDHMTKMMDGLSPREQEAFKKSYNLARYNGLIQ